jgi:hypothetical protein
MSGNFVSFDRDTLFLMPPSVQEWLPDGTFQEGWYQQFHSGSVDQAALSRSGLLIQTSLGSSTRLGSPLMNRSGVDA